MTIATEYQAEVSKLRERVSYLEAEVDFYKNAQPEPEINVRRLFGLTPIGAAILQNLSTGHVYSKEDLHELVCNAPSGIKTVQVHICKLRKAIAPIKISCEFRKGYFLEGEHLAETRAIIGGRKTPAKKLLGVE